jgi:hypothetical protein
MGSEEDVLKGYLSKVIQRLVSAGFSCQENVAHDGSLYRCVARRSRFELTKAGFAETFFLFAELPSLSVDSLRRFSANCFAYAKKTKKIPLPCGLFESVFCFPVAIVDGVDAAVAESVRAKAPPKHWASFEMPVVYDLRSNALHYFEKTPAWGAAYYASTRKTIQELLPP